MIKKILCDGRKRGSSTTGVVRLEMRRGKHRAEMFRRGCQENATADPKKSRKSKIRGELCLPPGRISVPESRS